MRKSRERRQKPVMLERLEVIDTGTDGRGVAKHEGLVVFIDGAVPGDVADVEVYAKKKNLYMAKPLQFLERSPYRTEPFCQHFSVCGGCKWQHFQYEHQLKFKQKWVEDAFQRVGHLEFPSINPIIGAEEKTRYYRNKLEFTFSNKRWLTPAEMAMEMPVDDRDAAGFHISGRFDKVLHIEQCHLMEEPVNTIRNAIHQYAIKNNLAFFDLREQVGFLRNLIIRKTKSGQLMVVLSLAHEDVEAREKLLNFLKVNFPEITSLMWVINGSRNDVIYGCEAFLYSGTPFIEEELRGVKYKIGPKSFFQTNSWQAEKLFDVVHKFSELKGDEVIYDLYTGIGTIALSLAGKAKHVVGIEQVQEAIDDAHENSRLNGIKNCTFLAGDVRDVVNNPFVNRYGKPDLLITDPPRAGMHKDVVQFLAELEPKKIVYVSCNPSTQARDLEMLAHKYEIKQVQPVDMFPHTTHVENVTLLVAK